VSLSTAGLGVVDFSPEPVLVHQSAFKPPKKGHILERLFAIRCHMLGFLEEWKPDFVAVEEIVKFVKGSGSTASTIILLATANRTAGLAVLEKTGRCPFLLPVQTVRSRLKLDHMPKKEEMPDLVAHRLGIDFPWITYTGRDGTTKNRPENYDMADAIAVALAAKKDADESG